MTIADVQMWLTFAVIAGAMVGFALERVPVEVTSFGVLAALILIFAVGPQLFGLASPLGLGDLLAGFANPALAAVLALIILGQALFQTGALDKPTRWIVRSARFGTWPTIAIVIVAAAALSAFLNNTPVVVMFIPVLVGLAREKRIPIAQVLMTLNFATILGGSTTLIGSSTNLLVAGVAERTAGLSLGMFDVTIPALVLAAFGLAYTLLLVPRLVGDRKPEEEAGASGKQFIAEIALDEDHPMVGKRAVAGLFPGLQHVTVRLIERQGRSYLPPYEDMELEPGDRVVFGGVRRELADLGIIMPPRPNGEGEPGLLSIAEAIVAPGARIVGRSPRETGIEGTTGVHVAAVERRGRMPRTTFADIRLEAGDVLLVAGTDEAFDRLRGNRDLLILERSVTALPARKDAAKAIVIFAGMVLLASSGILPIVTSALLAAFLVIALGCLNVRQARRAFDSRIFMLVGASLAAASALETTGGAAFLAHGMVALTMAGGAAVLLSALFGLIAVMTNVLSNNATAVLFTPIAISAALEIGAPVEPFVICVILAANASFATPIGYQTNLLVMGPGGYTFRDFLLTGAPLAILVWGVFTVFAPWYYGL
jgi:di/tricarboxylate transporter